MKFEVKNFSSNFENWTNHIIGKIIIKSDLTRSRYNVLSVANEFCSIFSFVSFFVKFPKMESFKLD